MIEQIETPEMLKARNEERSAQGLKKVRREQALPCLVAARAPWRNCCSSRVRGDRPT